MTPSSRAVPVLLAAAMASACGISFNFGRKVTDEELILRAEIRSYYDEVGTAFSAGNADRLAGLFEPGIGKPMTQPQIRAWGEDFFQKHGPAAFKVESIDYERVGHVSAVVTLRYRVETRDGDGSFGGLERDELVKRGRRWSIAAWEKLPTPPKP